MSIFVIQKHDATTLHYDFRIQINNALKSWAVPKKPGKAKGARNLAVLTTNHALKYANFEGEIPKGRYGAGSVKIWDKGTYKNLRSKQFKKQHNTSMQTCFQQGKIEIWLDGKKLKGGYALIRTQFKKNKKKPQWLLIKMNDAKIKRAL